MLVGQHHAVYACMMANTPFIPTFSNSHKIEAFKDYMKLPVMMCSNKTQADDEYKVIQSGNYDKAFQNSIEKLNLESNKLDKLLLDLFK